MTPGQRVLYRVRRLGPVSRRRRDCRGYVVFGVGILRSYAPNAIVAECWVDRDDGEPVIFDGVGLYNHEVRALGAEP